MTFAPKFKLGDTVRIAHGGFRSRPGVILDAAVFVPDPDVYIGGTGPGAGRPIKYRVSSYFSGRPWVYEWQLEPCTLVSALREIEELDFAAIERPRASLWRRLRRKIFIR